MGNRRTEIQSVGEFDLIKRITDNITLQHPDSIIGVGDDAAVIDIGDEYMTVSTDCLIENVHFDMTYSPLSHIGHKAISVNVSDICAMNSFPRQVLMSIAFSNRYSLEAIEELYLGVHAACQYYNIDLIGGDTSSSLQGLFLSGSCIGRTPINNLSKRSGAKENDLVYVSGDLGSAYLGLLILRREKQIFLENPDIQPKFDNHQYVVERQLMPKARVDIIEQLSLENIVPTSMIDISDGLASEAIHLSSSSNVGDNPEIKLQKEAIQNINTLAPTYHDNKTNKQPLIANSTNVNTQSNTEPPNPGIIENQPPRIESTKTLHQEINKEIIEDNTTKENIKTPKDDIIKTDNETINDNIMEDIEQEEAELIGDNPSSGYIDEYTNPLALPEDNTNRRQETLDKNNNIHQEQNSDIFHKEFLYQRNEKIRKVRSEIDFSVKTYNQVNNICNRLNESIKNCHECSNTIVKEVPEINQNESKTKTAITRIDNMNEKIRTLRNKINQYKCLVDYDNRLIDIMQNTTNPNINIDIRQDMKSKCTSLGEDIEEIKDLLKAIWKEAKAHNECIEGVNKELLQARQNNPDLNIQDFSDIKLSDLYKMIELIQTPEVETKHTIDGIHILMENDLTRDRD